jgi:hypothetical protein
MNMLDMWQWIASGLVKKMLTTNKRFSVHVFLVPANELEGESQDDFEVVVMRKKQPAITTEDLPGKVEIDFAGMPVYAESVKA